LKPDSVYDILAITSPLRGYEIWTPKQRDIRRPMAAEMKLMIHMAGYSLLDHGRNEDVSKQFKVEPVENKFAQYKQKWLNYVSRVKDV
jgi:hypothetical protein